MTFSYPPVFILLALLIGLLYAGTLYYRDRRNSEADSSFRRFMPLMALLRFVAVALLALLLLDPVLRYRKNETEKPLLLVALDNSASLALGPDSAANRAFAAQLSEWEDELGQEFDVRAFRFGSTLEEEGENAPDFSEPATDLSAALEGLNSRFANRNVGAVVLASDGIYNLGNNPAYGSQRLGAPVYSIGLGDTTQRRDLRIDRSYANRLVYLNDRFSLKLDLSALHAPGENASLRLEQIEDNGSAKLLDSRSISIDSDPFATSPEFIVTANRSGVMHLRAKFGPVRDEATVSNNAVDLFIDVLDSRQRMLLLANSPHPDLASIKQVMEKQGNYEVDLVMAKYFDGSLSGKDLVVLHQLPSGSYPLTALSSTIRSEKIPVLYVLGARTNLELFNRSQDLLRIRAGNGSLNEVATRYHPEFSLFQIDDALATTIRSFPPLLSPFGDYRSSPQLRILLSQRIGSVDTEYPLLAFGESAGARTGILAAEGTFRWRLFDYMESGNHDRYDELMGKTLQYLAVKSDRRNFRTILAKNLFTEKENISVQAELYNDSYEPVTTPDVDFTATNSDGKRYEYRFNREGNRYVLKAGALPAGQYTYVARTKLDSREFTSEGRFTVAPLQLEALDVTANHGLLAALSDATGGGFFAPGQLSALADSLRANNAIRPVIHESIRTRSVINLRIIFFVLLGLLSLEWLLRKINGAY